MHSLFGTEVPRRTAAMPMRLSGAAAGPDEKPDASRAKNRMKTKKKFKNAAKILVVQKLVVTLQHFSAKTKKQPRTLKDLQ